MFVMNKKLRMAILLLCSIATFILKVFFPVAGGGASLIFVLSIPFLMVLGIVFALMDYFLIMKLKNLAIKNSLFIIKIIILISLSLLLYPYAY